MEHVPSNVKPPLEPGRAASLTGLGVLVLLLCLLVRCLPCVGSVLGVCMRAPIRGRGRYVPKDESPWFIERRPPVLNVPNSVQPYQYKALSSPKSIRVLILHPGKSTDSLKCSLEEVDVTATDKPFVAVSYRWTGSQRRIYCEDARLDILGNLYDFLMQSRHPLITKVFWVDAICMNQKDSEEISQQLPLMSKIFSRCERCIIWLGGMDRETARGFQLLYRIDNGEKPTNQEWWKSLALLLANPWFERIWTFQEAVLPANVTFQYGSHSLDGNSFYSNIDEINDSSLHLQLENPGPGFALSLKISQLRRALLSLRLGSETSEYPAVFDDLLDALRNARERDASIPHDKVFGMSALYHGDMFESLVKIGYQESAELLFAHVARYILTLSPKPLRLLSAITPKDYSGPKTDLPLWIPDWRVRVGLSKQLQLFENTASYSAGGSEAHSFQLPDVTRPLPQQRLCIQGKLLSPLASFIDNSQYNHLTTVTEEFDDHYGDEPACRCLENTRTWSIYRQRQVGINIYSIRQFVAEIQTRIHRTLIAKREAAPPASAISNVPVEPPTDALARSIFWQVLTCEADAGPRAWDDRLPSLDLPRPWALQAHRALFEDLERWTRERKFALTADNSCAWVPLHAELGDWVCVFAGCDLPFVVRPLAAGGESFAVVGNCYVNGIMRGEAMRDESHSLRDIVLH